MDVCIYLFSVEKLKNKRELQHRAQEPLSHYEGIDGIPLVHVWCPHKVTMSFHTLSNHILSV